MGRRRDLPDLLQLSILRGRGEDHTGFFIIGFNHRSFEAFFSDISMRSDTAVFVKAFSFLRLLTGRGSSNGSAEIFHRRKRKSSFDEKRPFFGDFMRRACLSRRREFGAWEKLLAFQERKTRSHFFLRFSVVVSSVGKGETPRDRRTDRGGGRAGQRMPRPHSSPSRRPP